MAMGQIRSWWLLALAASASLTMAQMDHSNHGDHSESVDHATMDHSTSAKPTNTDSFPSIPTHAVRVGEKGRTFQPNNTRAKVGDTIEFQFYPTNHSVVRADYMWPCIPFEKVGNGKEGFFSGFFDVKDTDGIPKWRWTLNTENPVYFYSSGNDDCNRYGMVGAINAKAGDLQHQYDMALDAATVQQPDAAFDHLSTTTSTTSTPESTSTPTPTPTAQPVESSGSSGLGAGGIAGVVVGAVFGIGLIAALFYWYGIMRARQNPPTQPDASPMTKSSYLSPGAPSFDASSGMFTSPTHPSPPPPSALGINPHAAPFVDGDTIYVPVKRSTIASGDIARLPNEIYNPAELYHPGMAHNSDGVSWNRTFDQQTTTDANSIHQQATPTGASGSTAVNNKPSELSG